MVVKVRLEGLNVVRARGKWYVYRRAMINEIKRA